jgi:DNA primase
MGKISPVSYKYIVHTNIQIEGIVDRPDVIGAIFGQTEGLLGEELELRELQRSGRIGRIEVNLDSKAGKTEGAIIIPSSLDKAETAIIGAALETIQRIGPCNAKVRVEKIEDVRVSKRNYVIERAKALLKELKEQVLPDSQEITDEVTYSVRIMEIQEYGKDRLPSGPSIDDSEEIIVVEGRADVLNLLKYGFKNVIGMNGTSVPQTIVELAKKKVLTAFVDGDRGGDLIIRELSALVELDYITKAPDGKEVEEITKKEIHKALRNRIALEQVKMDLEKPQTEVQSERPKLTERPQYQQQYQRRPAQFQRKITLSDTEKSNFKKLLYDLIGTRGAYILDGNQNILGKVPTTEILATIKSLGSGINAIIFDGIITRDLAYGAERADVKHLIAMDSRIRPGETRVNVLTSKDFD